MDSDSCLGDLDWMRESYIENDKSASQIAEELGVSVNRVKKSLVLLNLRKTPPPEIDNEKLRQLYVVEERTLQQTADEFGVSVWTIMKWLAVAGIERRGHDDIDKGTWRGRHHTPESKLKISQSKDQGRKITSICEQCGCTFQHYEGSSDGKFCGIDCYNEYRRLNAKRWEEYDAVSDSPEYRRWRVAVYERDDYRCRWCGAKPKDRRLQAHHIWTRNKYPARMVDVSNGITLCEPCHYKTFYREEELASLFEGLLLQE
ncbi:MAG: HNH endonuclease [Chloroflexi bacterium]|nr:HNH endonuclease [Chloroflexota bacterium]